MGKIGNIEMEYIDNKFTILLNVNDFILQDTVKCEDCGELDKVFVKMSDDSKLGWETTYCPKCKKHIGTNAFFKIQSNGKTN